MSSHSKLDKIIQFRRFLLNELAGLSAGELNHIPAGSNNNIIWNLGHILATTQAVCYRRAGQPVKIDEQYFLPFLTNTKPGSFISQEEASIISGLLISTVHTLKSDYERRHFDNYTASENILGIYGIELHTIDDAIDFLLYHDGYHAAKIHSLKQLV
jgi:hypothetical protein